MSSTSPEEPERVPAGRALELPGRGTIFIRELSGPPGAPPILLSHGVAATGGINWLTSFGPLTKYFRVVALDHRGHGRGIHPETRFRFVDCADDVAAVARALNIRSAFLGGYSMGGPISQLVWKRHRPLVKGLVMAATCYRFVHGSGARMLASSAAGAFAQATRVAELAASVPLAGLRLLFPTQVQTSGSLGVWGASEVRRHSVRALFEAGIEIGRYNAESWVGEIDVPTAVVLTTHDRAVPPIWQLRLARAIPGATLHPLAEGHIACGHPLFGEVFTEAAVDVATRVAARIPSPESAAASAPLARAVPAT